MKLHQIYEDDLAELERILPDVTEALRDNLNNPIRTKIRRVQQILSNVRWNYGPHTEVHIEPEAESP